MIKYGDRVLLKDEKWRSCVTQEQQKWFFSVRLWLIDLPPGRSLVWWKLIGSVWVFDRPLASVIFHRASSPSGSPVIKEKATEGEGRYKRYWNWLLIFPQLTARPLRLRAAPPLHTERWEFCSFMVFFFLEAWENARVSCRSLFSCLPVSVTSGLLSICQSDVSIWSQADFWSSSLACDFNWKV